MLLGKRIEPEDESADNVASLTHRIRQIEREQAALKAQADVLTKIKLSLEAGPPLRADAGAGGTSRLRLRLAASRPDSAGVDLPAPAHCPRNRRAAAPAGPVPTSIRSLDAQALRLFPQPRRIPRAYRPQSEKARFTSRVPIHLTRDGGEQFRAQYRAINPLARVPSLGNRRQRADPVAWRSSEYLEEAHPGAAAAAAWQRWARTHHAAMALLIACDIHPLNNWRRSTTCASRWGRAKTAVNAGTGTGSARGLAALEALVVAWPRAGRLLHGRAG